MTFAAANVDVIWLFILALVGLICGIAAAFSSRPGLNLVAIGLIGISLAGVLAWWP